MTHNNARVYIKVGNTEFTIEGNPTFVSNQIQHTLRILDSKSATTSTAPKKQKNESESTKTKSKEKKSPKTTTKPTIQNHNQITDAIGNDFKDWLTQLPASHETRDKILIAAYYSQINNKDQRFNIPDIKRLFESHDLPIPKISGFLDTMEIQKLIFKVSNSTRKGYQLMDGGEQYVRQLLLNETSEE